MEKEEQLFKKRLIEQAQNADRRGYPITTDFMNLNELSMFHSIKKEFPFISYSLWGGYEEAERKMACFYDAALYENPEFPIELVAVIPSNVKFSDALTHRDYLGAVLNLGLDRSKIGDIIVTEQAGYLFCDSMIASYIKDNLTKIKHTNVFCEYKDKEEITIVQKKEEITGSISSNRIDSLIGLAFRTSRSSMAPLITGGKVFVDGKQIVSTSYLLKEGEIVSVRGYGKFIFQGIQNKTKKGRFYATVLRYK